MRTPAARRLSIVRNLVIAGCTGALAVDRALDGRWWWFTLTALVCAWATVDLIRTLRRGATAEATAAAAQEAAVARWSIDDLRDLRAQHGVDTSTSAGRTTLVKALRRADPRLGLAAAKNLVDGLDGVPRGGSTEPS